MAQAEYILAITPTNPSLGASVRWTQHGRANPEFSIVQELLDFLLLPSRKKFAQRDFESAKLRVTREILDTAFETREAFYMLQGAQQLQERLLAVAEVQSAAADLAKRLRDAGNINELEFKEQQSAALELELEIKRAHLQLQSQHEKLNRLMGLDGKMSWMVAPRLPDLPRSEPSAKSIEQRALVQRLDFAIAKLRVEQADAALGMKKKTRWLPGLKRGVDTERDPDGTQFTGPRADIELPLFGRERAEIGKLNAARGAASEESAALENDIRSQVREAHAAVVAARSASEFASGKLLPHQQEILRETLLHYNAMQKSNFELLAAKEREVRAERAAVEAQRDYWISRVALERAAGGRVDGEMAALQATHHAEH